MMKFEDYQPDLFVKRALPAKEQDFTHGQLWPTLVSQTFFINFKYAHVCRKFIIFLFQVNKDDDTIPQQRIRDMRKGVRVLRKMEQQRHRNPYNQSSAKYECSHFRIYPLRYLFQNFLTLHDATPEVIELMVQAADYGNLEHVHRTRDNQMARSAIHATSNRQKRQLKLDIAKNHAEFENWVERARRFEN